MNSRRLTSIAFTSRIFVILLQFFSNILIPDHNAHVFQYSRPKTPENAISSFLNFTLGGLIRWDAEYYMQIAKYGYTFENSLAFFPFYPMLVRSVTNIIVFFLPITSLDAALLLVFILSNIIFFIASVRVLYRLSLLIFDEDKAYKTCVLFCFNPASIFFTAPYAESLFCFLTFQSIYNSVLLLRKYSKPSNSFSLEDTRIIFCISLSTLVRSNGLLNIGFLVYVILCIFITYFPKNKAAHLGYIIKYIGIISLSFIIGSLPFILYQIYCFKKFCTTYKENVPSEIINIAYENNFILPGEFAHFNQSWCYNKLPLAYSYVQDHYWNVGFLRYYEFKQIPNFLLAAPCLYIIIKNCLLHLIVNFNRLKHILNLNELVSHSPQLNERLSEKQYFKLGLSAFVIHALFLAIFCSLCIHIQVSTRMICSATPLFYWYCTYHLKKNDIFIWIYFGSYVITGTIMFCNFLPWT